ncbi:uncharacterized protein FMAN_08228 [Fusarium mangiferae]|uniref:2EXR domain-containing protein n=1 Tax=Fusarium mangiferae TaxID=192010 RepID=A0A1L7TVU1_FUSMA|nr:uncharacterized protein FMAN_08228 [Fusarium mangiferae]CVL02119.1 uncharacterized protein FMAN_08228 [Fusarium mangiferae]
MAGPKFMDLPAEIQIKIIQLAIPPMILPEYLFADGKIGISNERDATRAIMATCHTFRNLLLKARPLTGHNSAGQEFTFDCERDALLVMGTNLPGFLKTPRIPNLHAVRRLVTLHPFPIGWASYTPMQRRLLRSWQPWAINVMGHHPRYTAYEENLPFETSFPIAQELGSLHEMDVVVKTAPGWHISSFQQHGPQPEHRRADPVSGDLNHPVHHTGIRWIHPRLDDYVNIDEVPMIGLHGYSKTRRDWRNQRIQEFSQGGQWAGFRVYLESEEVEFRPLTWDEVQPMIHRRQQPQNGRQLLENQDPEFVSRV